MRDHNPLIHRKGLQSVSKGFDSVDTSLAVQRKNEERKVYKQWQSIQRQMRQAQRSGDRGIFDFEQNSEDSSEKVLRYNDEILSIPNKIKLLSTFYYFLTHVMTLL